MKKILISTVLLLIILLLSFYWFAWRPAQIKHDCSWVKWTISAIPAYPSMTEDELRQQGLIQVCASPTPTQILKKNNVTSIWDGWTLDSCESNNKRIIAEYSKPRKAIPAKEGWNKTTDVEYKFCLRDKGL